MVSAHEEVLGKDVTKKWWQNRKASAKYTNVDFNGARKISA